MASPIGRIKVPAVGPREGGLMIVGEAPGAEEERRGMPFVGMSGDLLNKMLQEAGLSRHNARIVNVCPWRPAGNDISSLFMTKSRAKKEGRSEVNGRYPDSPIVLGLAELHREIEEMNPKVILCLGETALWGVTGKSGISFWRGSEIMWRDRVVIPTYHPAAVLRQWSLRYTCVRDMQRVRTALADGVKPMLPDSAEIHTGMPFDFYMGVMKGLMDRVAGGKHVWVAVDVETDIKTKEIRCVGLAFDDRAVVIPFMDREGRNYWNRNDQVVLADTLRELLVTPGVMVVGHNFAFDQQVMRASKYLGFTPPLAFDTMIAQHTAWPGLLKALDYCASVYFDHYCQWSLSAEDWKRGVDDEKLWYYNGIDCIVTLRLVPILTKLLEHMNLADQFAEQMRTGRVLLEMMQRGLRIDLDKREELRQKATAAMGEQVEWLRTVLRDPEFNPKSSAQVKELLYDKLRLKPIKHRKTQKDTADKEALAELRKQEVLLQPLIDGILNYRSLGVLTSTMLSAEPDPDGRMRTSYNLCKAHTFRLSSSTNVFGRGMNLQNVPKPDKGKSSGVNVREMIVPDEGFVLVECDLDRADLQVVVWEADDAELKAALRSGEDMHMLNAKAIFGPGAGKKERELAKKGVHLTNYAGSPRTLASSLGITRLEAERFQKRWFEIHPGIKRWHRRTESDLMATRMTTNRFGYKRVWFDRVEELLPEALAWVPQSTVGLVINHGLKNLREQVTEVQLLMQIHDSVVFQVRREELGLVLPKVKKALRVEIAYPEPLVIPASAKVSGTSWAVSEEVSW